MPKLKKRPRVQDRPGLTDALKFIHGKMESAFETQGEIEGLSTGCLAADMVCGNGGFPRGRITEVSGFESSAKTTLALTAFAECQRRGLYPVYIDAERGVDRTYAERIGCVFDNERKGLFLQTDTAEDAIIVIDRMVKSGDVDLIVCDSISALIPQDQLAGNIEDSMMMAARARFLSEKLPLLVKAIVDHNVSLVFVNQFRSKISTGWLPPSQRSAKQEETMGGLAIRFYASVRLEMKQLTRGFTAIERVDPISQKPAKVPTSSLHQVHAFKNKVAPTGRTTQFVVCYDPGANMWGIDNIATYLGFAVQHGVIEKAGAYFMWAGDGNGTPAVKGQGLEQFRAALMAAPESIPVLIEQVMAVPDVAILFQKG
jgi:recombination protein RecA